MYDDDYREAFSFYIVDFVCSILNHVPTAFLLQRIAQHSIPSMKGINHLILPSFLVSQPNWNFVLISCLYISQ